MRKVSIDAVIETCLTAIYKNDLLNEDLYLKGGQYLRIRENLKNRFSVDTDFSFDGKIQDGEIYFETLREALALEFHEQDLYLFSFKSTRRPKMKSEQTPDFWSGWGVEFKIIEAEKRNLTQDKLDREALIPEGTTSPKILIDISECEYCGDIDIIKLKSVEIKTYSRALVILEKLRAICQQHPDYPYKDGTLRARDYFDIEQLWNKAVYDQRVSIEAFSEELNAHLSFVFGAKDVDLNLLKRIQEASFVESQRISWPSVEATIDKKVLKSFDYYVAVIGEIIKYLEIPTSSI